MQLKYLACVKYVYLPWMQEVFFPANIILHCKYYLILLLRLHFKEL